MSQFLCFLYILIGLLYVEHFPYRISPIFALIWPLHFIWAVIRLFWGLATWGNESPKPPGTKGKTPKGRDYEVLP